LNGLLGYDPQGILHMAASLARSSEPGGFTLDSLAVRDMVEFVEAILADYRAEIRKEASLLDMLQLLDIFARAGWPEASRLVWRLDEVYR